jgi:hypothetical protein
MDSKSYYAYNETSKNFLSLRVTVVDAALEPLKVLRVLMEGLGPDARAGIWVTNFKGVPLAKTLSPFDLIYLDHEYRVVYGVEISTDGDYEPFRGRPASALVLPPQTIRLTKTRPGNQLAFRIAEDANPGTRPAQTDLRAPLGMHAPVEQLPSARFFNSAFPAAALQSESSPLDQFLNARSSASNVPASVAESAGSPQEQAQELRASSASVSGRLTKSAKSMMEVSPSLRPSVHSGPFAVGQSADSSLEVPQDRQNPISTAASDRAASGNLPARIFPASISKTVNIPPEHPQNARSSNSTPSGSLMKSATSPPETSPSLRPPLPTINTQGRRSANRRANPSPKKRSSNPSLPSAIPRKAESWFSPSQSTVIPISSGSSPAAQSAPAVPGPVPASNGPVSAVPAPVAASIPLAAEESFRTPPAPSSNTIPNAANELPPVPVHAGVTRPTTEAHAKELESRGLWHRDELDSESSHQAKRSWDVRLLYWVFPEFDPHVPQEYRMPRMYEKDKIKPYLDPKSSAKLRFLCWLFPELHLERVEKYRREERRALRLPLPGLVAYFFTGGSPRPHEVKDISVTGFYMHTNERWLPGTIIRITLQIMGSTGENPRDTITVHSRVVRWGMDGEGFEFVMPGFMD